MDTFVKKRIKPTIIILLLFTETRLSCAEETPAKTFSFEAACEWADSYKETKTTPKSTDKKHSPPRFVVLFHTALNNYGNLGFPLTSTTATNIEKKKFSRSNFDPILFEQSIDNLLSKNNEGLKSAKKIENKKEKQKKTKTLKTQQERIYEYIIRYAAFITNKNSNNPPYYIVDCLMHHTHDLFSPAIECFFDHVDEEKCIKLKQKILKEAQHNHAPKIYQIVSAAFPIYQPIPLHPKKIKSQSDAQCKSYYGSRPQKSTLFAIRSYTPTMTHKQNRP